MKDFRDGQREWEIIQSTREKLRTDKNYSFISAEQYYELIVSNAQFQRIAIPEGGLVGLCDPESEHCYVVESEQLETDRTW